jgi:hypothetical protein
MITSSKCDVKFIDGGGGDAELFWKFHQLSLGFSVPRLLIGEGAMSGVGPGTLTLCRRGQAPGRTSLACGAFVALLLLSFGSLEASGKNMKGFAA